MCLLRADDAEAKAFADELYAKMNNSGMEVLYDDREDVRPGAMFADADLIGAPIRVIVGPKNLQEGLVEIVSRDKSISMKVNKDEVIEKVMEIRAEMFAKINEKRLYYFNTSNGSCSFRFIRKCSKCIWI